MTYRLRIVRPDEMSDAFEWHNDQSLIAQVQSTADCTGDWFVTAFGYTRRHASLDVAKESLLDDIYNGRP